MVEKRRASERVRGEPATKRKAVGVRPTRSNSISSSPAARPAQPVEERLPSKLDENSPLPTLPRGTKLTASTLSHLQSIAESGVLASSLQKSRNAWLTGGLFEKFYTKPTKKKKGENELLNNPPANCMSKIGYIKLVIEPHVFEGTLYSIRDWTPQPAMPAAPPAAPLQSPISTTSAPGVPPSALSSFQTGPSPMASMVPRPSAPSTGSVPAPSNVTPQAGAITQSSTGIPSVSTTTQPGPSQPTTPAPTAPSVSAQSVPPPHATQNVGAPLPAQQPQPFRPNPSLPPPPPQPSSQDPVIQMLAHRASLNPELKALMKIVAAGHANPEQLEKFQKHINELNEIVARQRLATTPTVAGNNYGSPGASAPRFTPAPVAFGAAARPSGPGGTPIYQRAPTSFSTPQPPIKTPKAPKAPPAPVPNIIGLAIEFAQSNGDRYLFPKYSILEYVPDAKCIICSWLVVRQPGLPSSLAKQASVAGPAATPPIVKVKGKGKDKVIDTKQEPSVPQAQTSDANTTVDTPMASAAPVKPAVDAKPLRDTLHMISESRLKSAYHQPVTMRLYTDTRKVFEMISSSASTADEARRFMEDIMSKTKRAEDVVLAMRLPTADDKDKGDGSGADESGLGSPAPGTPLSAVAARRASLLKPGFASPTSEGKRLKKMAKVEEYCEYCFSPVSRAVAAAAAGDGQIACDSCVQLLVKNGKLGGRRYVPGPMKRTEGPKALTI